METYVGEANKELRNFNSLKREAESHGVCHPPVRAARPVLLSGMPSDKGHVPPHDQINDSGTALVAQAGPSWTKNISAPRALFCDSLGSRGPGTDGGGGAGDHRSSNLA